MPKELPDKTPARSAPSAPASRGGPHVDGPQIPTDRPILGRDLVTLRQRLGHSLGQSLYLYGMYAPKYSALTSTGPNKHGNDVVERGTVAIMTRLLDVVPEWDPLPKPIPFTDFVELLQQVDNTMTLKKIGIMLGGDSNSAYRWMHGKAMFPVVQHLIRIIYEAVRQHGKPGLDLFTEIVEIERQARGKTQDNFYNMGSWREDKEK